MKGTTASLQIKSQFAPNLKEFLQTDDCLYEKKIRKKIKDRKKKKKNLPKKMNPAPIVQ